jgi:Subtilase family
MTDHRRISLPGSIIGWLFLSLLLRHCLYTAASEQSLRSSATLSSAPRKQHQQRQQQRTRSLFSWTELPSDIKTFWYSLLGKQESSSNSTASLPPPVVGREDDGFAYMVVKVNSESGRDILYGMSEIMIEKDFISSGYIAVRVANEHLDEVIELIELEPDIEGYEENGLFTDQGILDHYVSEEELGHRHLEEVVPYGITMAEGDQVVVGSSPVTVCIIDTGVARAHPDLNANLLRGTDRVSDVDQSALQWYNDTRGHGTHISGTIAAQANNGIGVRGMGAIPLFLARGLNNVGQARESDLIESMEQCEAAGAKILSFSLSGSSMSSAMKTVIDRIYANGGLIIAAAGNQGIFSEGYPASDPNVISVGAVTSSAERWSMSNYGPSLELVAAGDQIYSTVVRDGSMTYAYYSGTSMATPHVAAAAALVWSHYPECTNVQIRYALAYTAQDVGDQGCDDEYGYGIVKTKQALDFLDQNGCSGASWGQETTSDGHCSTIDT